MELLRQDTDYAMRAMVHLALTDKNENTAAVTLAKKHRIPISFGHKILRKLVAARLVESRPGRSGGFRMACPTKSIRLLDIVQAIQGPVIVSTCMLSARACAFQSTCRISPKWKKLQREIVHFLKSVTLADIVQRR